jgi:hypothetical protein
MFHGLGCLLLCRSSMFTAFFSHIHLDFFIFFAFCYSVPLESISTYYFLHSFERILLLFIWQLGEKECIDTLSSTAR